MAAVEVKVLQLRVYLMPLVLSAVLLIVIQSIASRRRIGKMKHACLAPDCTGNHSVRGDYTRGLHSKDVFDCNYLG